MACTTWKMDDLDGPSRLRSSQTWCLDTVFSSVPACGKGWKEGFGHAGKVHALPGGVCAMAPEICISGHVRLRAGNHLRSGG